MVVSTGDNNLSSLLFEGCDTVLGLIPLYSNLLCKDFEAVHRSTYNTIDKMGKDTGANLKGAELPEWLRCQNACQRAPYAC